MGSLQLQRMTLGWLIEIVVAATPSEKNVFGKPMGDLIHVEVFQRELKRISFRFDCSDLPMGSQLKLRAEHWNGFDSWNITRLKRH